MKKPLLVFSLFSMLTLMALPIQANFVQCPGGTCDTPEGTSDNADIINGTPGYDLIRAKPGNDFVFGGPGNDELFGDAGNDIVFGGLGSDEVFGIDNEDVVIPGPDDPEFLQRAFGGSGNDNVISMASETSGCMEIFPGEDVDIVSLIGFGPYIWDSSLAQNLIGAHFIRVVDPIAGGRIFIQLDTSNSEGAEFVYGLPTPNPTILTGAEQGDERLNTCPPTLP